MESHQQSKTGATAAPRSLGPDALLWKAETFRKISRCRDIVKLGHKGAPLSPDDFTERFADLRVPIAKFLYRRVEVKDVDDLSAEVFEIAWRKGGTVTVGEELPWLYRVATNLVANHRRKNARAQNLLAAIVAPDTSPSAESIAVADIALAEAWGRLPATSRQVLAMTALDGLSVAETALALDITANAVSVRLNRARNQLRVALAETV